MSTQLITVTIHKWAKHNGNKKKGHRAILVDTGIFSHPRLLSVSEKARLLYFWLLGRCGDELTATTQFIPKQAQGWCGFGRNVSRDCVSAVTELQENQMLTIQNFDSLIEENRKEKNSSEQKIKSEKAPTSSEFDFDSLRSEYPRPDGWNLGVKRLRARDWDQTTFELFRSSLRRYASECRLQRLDRKYVKHFSTFVGTTENEPWRDFITPPPVRPGPCAPMPLNEPPFDPVEVNTIRNPHAVKLLNLVTRKESLA